MRKTTKEKFNEEMKDPEKKAQVNVSRAQHESRWDLAPGQFRNAADVIELPQFLQAEDEHNSSSVTFWGYFWDTDVCDREGEPYEVSELETHDDGRQGKVMDRRVIGATELSSGRVKRLKMVSELANTATAVDKGHVAESLEHQKKMIGASAKKTATIEVGADGKTSRVVLSGASSADVPQMQDGSDDDFMPTVGQHFFQKPAGSHSPAKKSGQKGGKKAKRRRSRKKEGR